MSDLPVIPLRPKADRRARSGHPWVYSNELAVPVRDLPPGGAVDLVDDKGRFVGRGYANPSSLIAVRLLTRNRREDIDHPAFFVHRLREALQVRQVRYPGRRSLRLVHSEGDGLPGLVVDRHDDVLAVQLTTLGMEQRRDALAEALAEVFAPRGAVLRNDGRIRRREGLEQYREVWFGEVPDEVIVEEYGVRYVVAPLGGQKTGHFYDQADNRRRAGSLAAGRTVLDVYAHTGGWALHALAQGATRAVTIDQSEEAAEATVRNADLNGFDGRVDVICDEAGRSLEALVGQGRRFGVVVVDPPAFAKTRKAIPAALRGYQRINGLAAALVEPGGLLFTSTCSFHVDEQRFAEVVAAGARRAGRRVRVVLRGDQAGDHPALPMVPETRYLKSLGMYVTMDR